MTILRSLEDFEPGELARCVRCGVVFDPGAEYDEATVRCPSCEEVGAVPHDPSRTGGRSMARRWGEDVGACGHVGLPNVLLAHLAALGLDATDVLLLALLEQHRRTSASEPVWPGADDLASRSGLGERQVRRRLSTLVDRGLLEVERRRCERGRWPVNAYTRAGLTRALDLIAHNRRAGRDDVEGLADLLAELAGPADLSDRRTSVSGGHQRSRPAEIHDRDRRTWVSAEVEAVEAEAEEAEPSSEASTRERADVLSSSDEIDLDWLDS